MKQGLVKIAKWLMVVLFMSYYFSTTLFYHTHHFQWGTVTHFHPYIPFEGGMPSHSHTAEQCATIGLLSAIVLWIAVAPSLLFARTIVTPIYVFFSRYVSHLRLPGILLRAPPVFICG